MYYFLTDHIGNARVVASASGGVVEESDYLPFGTENVITSTLDNNYKFIGMERDFEGTAALDHTLYPQYRFPMGIPPMALVTPPRGDPGLPHSDGDGRQAHCRHAVARCMAVLRIRRRGTGTPDFYRTSVGQNAANSERV